MTSSKTQEVAALWMRRFPESVRVSGERMRMKLGLQLRALEMPAELGERVLDSARLDLYCLPIYEQPALRWWMFGAVGVSASLDLIIRCAKADVVLHKTGALELASPGDGKIWRRDLERGKFLPQIGPLMQLAATAGGV